MSGLRMGRITSGLRGTVVQRALKVPLVLGRTGSNPGHGPRLGRASTRGNGSQMRQARSFVRGRRPSADIREPDIKTDTEGRLNTNTHDFPIPFYKPHSRRRRSILGRIIVFYF